MEGKINPITKILLILFLGLLTSGNWNAINKTDYTIQPAFESIEISAAGNYHKEISLLEDDISTFNFITINIYSVPQLISFITRTGKTKSLNYSIWNPPENGI